MDGLWRKFTCRCIISVVGLVGNSLVVFVFITQRKMRTTNNIMLLSLAFSDIAFLCLVMVRTFDWIYGIVSATGDFGCKILFMLWYAMFLVTVSTLVLISVVRYIAVAYPLRSRLILTTRNMGIAVCSIWVCSILACSPAAFDWEVAHHPSGSYCTTTLNVDPDLIYILTTVFFFFLPLMMICFFSLATYCKIKQTRKIRGRALCGRMEMNNSRVGGNGLGNEGQRGNNNPNRDTPAMPVAVDRETKLIIMSVVFAYCVCYGPNFLCMLIPQVRKYPIVGEISFFLLCLNSCINPLIYTCISPKFRKAFKQALCYCQCNTQ